MSKTRPRTYHFGYTIAMIDTYEKCYEWNTSENRRRDSYNVSRPSSQDDGNNNFWKFLTAGGRNKKNECERNTSNKRLSADSSVDVNTCYCMNHTKTARRRRFKSQSGYYLAMLSNGKIIGTKDERNKYTEIDVIPVGSNLVKIWGVQAGLFLMIDDAGHMRGTDVDSAECIFEEALTENFFTIYYSAMYLQKRWCITLQNKQSNRSFYRKQRLSRDTTFVTEIVNRRSSMSSQSNYSDDSRTCSI